jgi:hypothetical protein
VIEELDMALHGMVGPQDPLILNQWVMRPMYLEYHWTRIQTFEEAPRGHFSHCLLSDRT